MEQPLLNQNLQKDDNKKNQQIKLIWKNIDLKIDIKIKKEYIKKHILNDISGYAKSGECLAILGGSGAGKSTLLNILSDRFIVQSNMILWKLVQVNGQQMKWDLFKEITGFVTQSDINLENLTINQTLKCIVDLFNQESSEYIKQKKLKKIIQSLKLETSQHNIVGGDVKGISGGEKRRLSIGQELLKKPRIIFLDEPTSGLDSYTGYVIVSLLKKLAKKYNMIVIYTIHQPSEAITTLFDRVLILNSGNLIFFDYFENLEKCFQKLQINVPNDIHLIEYALLIIQGAPQIRQKIKEFYEDEDSGFKNTQKEIENQYDNHINLNIRKKSFFKEVGILYKRGILNYTKNPKAFSYKFIQNLFIAMLFLLMFWNQEDISLESPRSIQNRLGALFIISLNLFFMYFNTSLSIFAFEKAILAKEYENGYYSLGSYYMSKVFVEFPIITIFPTLFSCIIYYFLNFNKKFSSFGLFIIGCVIESWLGTIFGIVLACITKDWDAAIEISPLISGVLVLYTGYAINIDNIWKYLRFLQYISPIKYSFEYLVYNEFQDKLDELGEVNPIKTLNFELDIPKIILIDIALFLSSLLIGFLALKFKLRKLKN